MEGRRARLLAGPGPASCAILYRGSVYDCQNCALKPKISPSMEEAQIPTLVFVPAPWQPWIPRTFHGVDFRHRGDQTAQSAIRLPEDRTHHY